MAYVYHAPTLTVDVVVFQVIDGRLHVLLIKRKNEPFKGELALPGGYNAAGDTTRQAMDRVLKSKVGLSRADFPFIEQLYAFDTVARDPRGHAVSIVYMALGNNLECHDSETTQEPAFYPVDELGDIAFDHEDIVAYAVERLRARITSFTAVFALLPEDFTLTQLQTAYEAVLGRKLDKRNFRKKFLSFDVLEPTDKYYQEGAHRPALLYRFKERKIQPLLRDF
ncbi:NUDIX hydrolase [Candidatus Saccharibacteria bacterium]|nr:NUDIX hydrolase [Candidatus Saccharibacteria bacterium]